MRDAICYVQYLAIKVRGRGSGKKRIARKFYKRFAPIFLNQLRLDRGNVTRSKDLISLV